MLRLDPRSFIITTAVLAALCAFIFSVLRRSFPRDIGGIGYWASSCAVMTLSGLLFVSRGATPLLFSSVLANVLVAAGVMLMYAALNRFTERKSGVVPWRMASMALVALAAVLWWLTYVYDDYRARVLLMAGVNTVLFALCAFAILGMQRRRFAEHFTAGIFLITAAMTFLRFGAALFQPDHVTPVGDISSIQYAYLATFAFSVVAVSLGFLMMINQALQARLEYSASRDSLTDTYTRGAFFALIEQEMRRSERSRQSLSLLMIDLDNFKAINDQYGHPVGDKVIRDFARRTQAVLRAQDSLGRYGGEEFGVLLPDTSREGAGAIANRIRAAFDHPPPDDLPSYTVSVGVASTLGSQECVEKVLARADQALYIAKKSGKNRVEMLA